MRSRAASISITFGLLTSFLLSSANAQQTNANDPLLKRIDQAIEVSRQRYLTADLHTPWQIMHGMLAFRGGYEVLQGDKTIPVWDYVTSNPQYRGEPWFEKNEYGGECHYFTSPYIFEGHRNQFFAIMSMSDLPTDFEFQTDDGVITVKDLINNAKMRVTDDEEITWTLWALSNYLSVDSVWTNAEGERWSMDLLVRIQTRYDPLKSPCGGTHGLFSLTRALDAYRKTGREPRGYWLAAQNKVDRYIKTAQSLQNRDGSFSAAYFKGKELSRDFNKRVETTGHTLEFIVSALPESRLRERWVQNAVAALCSDLIRYSDQAAKVGPLYHAVDALVIYKERLYGLKTSDPVLVRRSEEKSPETPEPEAVAVSDPELPVEAMKPEPLVDPKIAAELEALKKAEAELVTAVNEAEAAQEAAKEAAETAVTANQAATAAQQKADLAKTEAARLNEIAEEKQLLAERKAELIEAMRREIEARQVASEAEGEQEPLERKEPRVLKPKQVSNLKPVPVQE